jgi:hypothetical protein
MECVLIGQDEVNMALVFVGATRCVICHEVIEKGQEYIAFPPFVPNKLDPLILFNDAACHQTCFINHPLADAAQLRTREILSQNNYICAVCGLEITNPDDFFMLPHWTDSSDSKLFEFNYLKFHLSHLAQWSELNLLYELLLDLEKSGTWEGNSLAYVLETIHTSLSQE